MQDKLLELQQHVFEALIKLAANDAIGSCIEIQTISKKLNKIIEENHRWR